MLDDGKGLGMPDAIMINGKAPSRYDTTLVPDGLQYETVGVEPATCSPDGNKLAFLDLLTSGGTSTKQDGAILFFNAESQNPVASWLVKKFPTLVTYKESLESKVNEAKATVKLKNVLCIWVLLVDGGEADPTEHSDERQLFGVPSEERAECDRDEFLITPMT